MEKMTAKEDTSFTKLPIEERCIHKSWKARISGYEDALVLFKQLDKKSHDWNKYTGIIKLFVVDGNAIAQKKGLAATLVFVENSETAGSTAQDVVNGLITKCYGAPKEKIRDIAIKITLMYIEIEKQDIVIDELVKGMDHKFPKIVSTCIKAATQSITEFGSKVLHIKPLLNKLQLILEYKDKNVRSEAKLLTVVLYSSIGPTRIKAILTNLKPLQIQELESEFEKITGSKLQPTRLLRSQQKQTVIIEAEKNGDLISEESPIKVAAFEEHIDPVNIFCQLNQDFYEKLEARQWQERKKAVDMLAIILDKAQKLESGDYGDVVKALMKIITKDTNVAIIGIAAKCLTNLANKLKKQFEIYTLVCIPALLEKFKEKKQNVLLPLRDTVDAIYLNTTLESIADHILTAIDNKNPSVRAESVSFLARCFVKCTPTILNKKLLKMFTTALIKTLNESDPTVRDNSAEALGIAWKIVSEKNILPFLTNVDVIKLAKIKEVAEKAIIIAKSTTVVNECASKSDCVLRNSVETKTTVLSNSKNIFEKNQKIVSNMISTCSKSTALNNHHKLLLSKNLPQIETENKIDDDELDKLALTFCSSEILNGMIDINWEIRLSSVQELYRIIDKIERPIISSQVLIRLLNKKAGIIDTNIEVQKLKLECLNKIIQKFPITSISMECCIQDVSCLLSDTNHCTLACQVLTSLAKATRLDIVSIAALDYAFSVQENPIVQINILNWLSNAILEFGFIIEPTTVMQNIKKAVNSSNSQVRMATISLLGVIHLFMGSQLSLFFENEKSTLIQQIIAEFKEHQNGVLPKPISEIKIEKSTETLKDTINCRQLYYEDNIQNSNPRVDITSQITDVLINDFSNKDWKIRSNAITKLQNIINGAKFITSELGEVRQILQERISDSNARVSSNAIHVVELISVAMGPSFKNYIKGYLPNLLSALGDSKIFKLQSARQCMNTWADVCGYREFFGNDILLDALKNNSVALRSELWSWLAEHLPIVPHKIIPADELKCLLPVLYCSLEDKNSRVRSASDKAILGFMMHLGYAFMYEACEKLKPLSIKVCKEKLDKERPNLPITPNEKPKIIKTILSGNSSVKLKGSKTSSKVITKINKENVISCSSAITGKADNKPLFQQNNLKEQRFIDEHKLKALKWNFTTLREEFVEQLREQMQTAGINKELITNMFHSDFKYHLKAINTLSKDLNATDDGKLGLIHNLDLVLKWMTIRYFDTNPSVLLKSLEYLQNVFDMLIVQKYTLFDMEASCFLPYFVTKLGDPKDTVRNNVRLILKQIVFVYSKTKMFSYILNGIKSKNSRQRSECLDHLATMIKDKNTSICLPTIETACKKIAKSIGERDNSVRTSALNCLVAVFILHGDALFKFIDNIPKKDMGLLNERLKRVSKDGVVPVATVQPTVQNAISSSQQVVGTEVTNDYDSDNEYNISDILQESNHEQSFQRNSNNNSPSTSANSSLSCKADNISTLIKHSSLIETEIRDLNPEVTIKPKLTRFSLDEKLIRELDAEVIKKPQLTLTPYKWTTDHEEINFRKVFHVKSRYLADNFSLSKPCLNVSPYYNAPLIKKRFENSPVSSIDLVQQLINKVTSQDKEVSKTAMTSLSKILMKSYMRPECLDNGKVLMLFYAINKQFDILFESNDIVGFMIILNLCLNMFKYQEFMLLMNDQIVCDLLSKTLRLLSMNRSVNGTDSIKKCVNSVIMEILERADHTTVTCVLLTMLYDMVKYPETSTDFFKELLMKCLWKIVKDFSKWGNKLNYDLVLVHIHTFLEAFDLNYWRKQQSNIPLRTCKTVLHTLTKLNSTKILDSLSRSGFSNESEMVIYIHKLVLLVK